MNIVTQVKLSDACGGDLDAIQLSNLQNPLF